MQIENICYNILLVYSSSFIQIKIHLIIFHIIYSYIYVCYFVIEKLGSLQYKFMI